MNASDVKKAAVIGAGIMGHSIAQVFAQAGIETSLVDLNEEALRTAAAKVAANLGLLADNGLLEKEDVEGIIGCVHPSTDLAGAAANADFVLEAVPEVPEVKKEVFKQLGAACRAETARKRSAVWACAWTMCPARRRSNLRQFGAPLA